MRGEYARGVTEGLGRFEALGELVKGWDEAGVWRFEGVAASGALDRQGERLTAQALGRIAQSQGVELRAAHRAGRIGMVEECWVTGEEVWVRGRLEEHSAEAARVYTQLKRGEKLGLSVGGKVTGARWAWDAEVEKPVRLIEDVELSHVAVCAAEAAVNPGTWVRTASSPPGPHSLGGPAGEGENGETAGALPPSTLSLERSAGEGENDETAGASPPSPLRSGERRGGATLAEEWTEPEVRRTKTDHATDVGEVALGERLARLEARIRELEGELQEAAKGASGAGLGLAEVGTLAHPESDAGETIGAAGSGDWGSDPAIDGGTAGEGESASGESFEGGAELSAGTTADAVADGPGECEAILETTKVVVRRGEPQGLCGHMARPVRAARVWEGVL